MEKRAAGYDLPFVKVDGNDLEAVHFAGQEAIAYVRSGKGPFVMQADTYRIEGHYFGDAMVYRSTEEVDEWRKKDPIMRVEKLLLERGILKEPDFNQARSEIQQEVDEAVAFAEASPQPAIESIFEDVYTEWQA